MRKVTIILLVAAAIPIYVWDAWLLLTSGHGPSAASQVQTAALAASQGISSLDRTVHFIQTGKSPFSAYNEPAVTAPVIKNKPVVTKPAASFVRPNITISGIMWNLQNPVAMLVLPDGSSTAAKAGQTLVDGIILKTVEKNRVQITSEGTDFWLNK